MTVALWPGGRGGERRKGKGGRGGEGGDDRVCGQLNKVGEN